MKEKEFIRKPPGRPISIPENKITNPAKDEEFSINILKNFQQDSGNIENQFIAIKIMEMNARISDEDNLIPEYKKVSQMLDVSEAELRKWWINRAKIIEGVKIVNKELGEFVQLKMTNLIVDLINSLAKVDLNEESVRDKTQLMNTLFNRLKDVVGTGERKKGKRREIGKLIPERETR